MNNKPQIVIPLTARQKQMTLHPARVLWLGCGTKTGKTVGLASWIVEGILSGEPCAWVGPWFARARSGYETIRSLVEPLIQRGVVRGTDGTLRMRATSGGSLECFSADNAQAVFGGNYSRVVIDEASRCPESVYSAALTTISATNGRLRCAFNLELGSKNWAIRNLLRVQAMSFEQRIAASEDFLTFPTGGDGLVDPVLIEALRSQMPEVLWRALYLAEVPESDISLFRNLDKIFIGHELDAPLSGHHYCAGIDLGRKQDFTVVTIIDTDTGEIVASDRFHQISWTLQCERAAELYRKFRCAKVFVDATGLGDPVSEELRKLGLDVEPFIFSAPSRKSLLETLILACDNCQISLPATEKFQVYRHELEAFEYTLDGSTIRYAAPPSMHDDCVMSLALAVHGYKLAHTGELGVIGWLKGVAKKIFSPDGEPKPQADAIATPIPEPEIVAPTNCERCGSGGEFRKFGTGPNAKYRCQTCGKFHEGIKPQPKRSPWFVKQLKWRGVTPRDESIPPAPCKCGAAAQRIGADFRCANCGVQWNRSGEEIFRPVEMNFPGAPCVVCGSALTREVGGCGIRCSQCGHSRFPKGTPAIESAMSRRDWLSKQEGRWN